MTFLILAVIAVLLFILMAKAIKALLQESPRNQRLPQRLQPRLDGDTET